MQDEPAAQKLIREMYRMLGAFLMNNPQVADDIWIPWNGDPSNGFPDGTKHVWKLRGGGDTIYGPATGMMERSWRHNYNDCDIIAYRPLPPAPPAEPRVVPPAVVPLEAADVPPGTAISHPKWGEPADEWWRLIEQIQPNGLNFGLSSTYYWQELMDNGWLIKRPGEDWQPASKPSGA